MTLSWSVFCSAFGPKGSDQKTFTYLRWWLSSCHCKWSEFIHHFCGHVELLTWRISSHELLYEGNCLFYQQSVSPELLMSAATVVPTGLTAACLKTICCTGFYFVVFRVKENSVMHYLVISCSSCRLTMKHPPALPLLAHTIMQNSFRQHFLRVRGIEWWRCTILDNYSSDFTSKRSEVGYVYDNCRTTPALRHPLYLLR